MKQNLTLLSDYDEVKRELEIMKACCTLRLKMKHGDATYVSLTQFVEFGGIDDDRDPSYPDTASNGLGLSLPDPKASRANSAPNKSLEVLLAAKNTRITEELTRLRASTSRALFTRFYPLLKFAAARNRYRRQTLREHCMRCRRNCA